MEEWVERALKRWPNVPALYGWLRLDRRGRWLIKGETIGRTQIVDVFDRNYASDDRGCWYFQNGPQRGYMQLERAPFIVHVEGDELLTHTRLPVRKVTEVFMDETGGLFLQTEHGPSALLDTDLEWALDRIFVDGRAASEKQIAAALALPSGAPTLISLQVERGPQSPVAIMRLDDVKAPEYMKFVRDPEPPVQ